jgi:hypothetical protein
VRLSLHGTSASNWPIVPVTDDRWWMRISRWNDNWQGKSKYSEKTCLSAILSTTNPTLPDLHSNPGRRDGKPATNRVSYGTACHSVKTYEGNCGTVPLILNLGTGWRWVVSFTPIEWHGRWAEESSLELGRGRETFAPGGNRIPVVCPVAWSLFWLNYSICRWSVSRNTECPSS